MNKLPRFKSARARAILAGAVMLFFLASMTGLATWSTHHSHQTNHSLQHRATAAASLANGRAHFYMGATLLSISVFSEDPSTFISSYGPTAAIVDYDLQEARDALVALNETDSLIALDETTAEITELFLAIDSFIPGASSMSREERLALTTEYIPQMWPQVSGMMADLERLADQQQTKLAAERSAADRASDLTLATLFAFGVFAFLTAAGTFYLIVGSVIRPLAALQASAKAIASGNWTGQARVSGPQEVSSLAQDFNTMTETLLEKTAQLQESEQLFRGVLDASRDFIYKINLQTGTYDYVSPSIQVSGFTPEEFLAMGLNGVYERLHPDDRERLVDLSENLLPMVQPDNTATTIEYRWKHKNGEYRWLSDSIVAVLGPEGKPTALVGISRDVTDQKEVENALRELGEQRALRNRIAEGFLTASDQEVYADVLQIILEATASVYGFFGYINEDGDLACPSMTKHVWDQCRMIGKDIVLRRESWGGIWGRALTEKKTFLTNHAFHVPQGHIQLDRALVVPIMHQDNVIGEIAIANKATDYGDEDRLLVEAAVSFVAPILSARLERDTEEKARKEAEDALREQARCDPLTGALNHGAIVDELARLVARGVQGPPFVVAMTDVNDLKTTNDKYGHQVGDSVLIAVAHALTQEGALVGRYGGDEFVSILPSASREEAEHYCREAGEAMGGVELIDQKTGDRVTATASIGLAVFPEDASTVVELIKMSDVAMYAQKRQRPIDRAA